MCWWVGMGICNFGLVGAVAANLCNLILDPVISLSPL